MNSAERDVARTAEGLRHANAIAAKKGFRGFYVRSVHVKNAYPVAVQDDTWDRTGRRRSVHYDYVPPPGEQQPTNPRHEPAQFAPIVCERGIKPILMLAIGFWPALGMGETLEEIILVVSVPELGLVWGGRQPTGGVYECDLTCETALPLGLLSRGVSMRFDATTKDGVRIGGTTTIGGFELMTVVGQPRHAEDARDSGVTSMRVRGSIRAVDGTCDHPTVHLHTVAEQLTRLGPAVLSPDPAIDEDLKHPRYDNARGGAWWILANTAAGGECQAMVRMSEAVMRQIGLDGDYRRYNVWAEPHPDDASTIVYHEDVGEVGGLSENPHLIGGKPYLYGLIRGQVTGGLVLNEDDFPISRYEACLRVQADGVTRYYLGGTDYHGKKPEDVVRRAFNKLIRFSWLVPGLPPGGRKYRVHEIVHTW